MIGLLRLSLCMVVAQNLLNGPGPVPIPDAGTPHAEALFSGPVLVEILEHKEVVHGMFGLTKSKSR